MTTVAGLDLSLTGTGVCRLATGQPATLATIGSAGKRDDTLAQRHQRLVRLAGRILHAVGDVDLAVVEGPAYASTTGHMHDRSGLWWLVVHGLRNHAGRVVEVTPASRCRYATGKGNAPKDAVLAAVVRRYPGIEVGTNDEADALVLAAMGARALGDPIEERLPQANLAKWSDLRWGA